MTSIRLTLVGLLLALFASQTFAEQDDSAAASRGAELMRASSHARRAESDGKYGRALELWQFVDANKPGDYSAYHGIIRCLTALGKFDEGLEYIDKSMVAAERGVVRFDPTAVTADRIELLYRAGRDFEAEQAVSRALERYRGNVNIYRELAGVFSVERMVDRSIDIMRRGRVECRNPFLFARDIASLSEALMDFDTAIEEYLLYLREKPDRLSYVTGAVADMPAEMRPDSIAGAIVKKNYANAPPEFETVLHRLMASLYFRARNYPMALARYQQLERTAQSKGGELLEFAQLLLSEGETKLALKAYNDILADAPTKGMMISALVGKGRAFELTGGLDSAEAAYQTVLFPGTDPHAAFEAYSRLGSIVIRRGGSPATARANFDEALKIAGPARITLGQVVELRVESAQTWAREGNLDRAESELEQASKGGQGRAETYTPVRAALAKLAYWKGDYDRAGEIVTEVLNSDPSSTLANDLLTLRAVITDLKGDASALRALGLAELTAFQGDADKAARILDSLAGASSGRAAEEALWQLYRLELSRDDFTVALEAVDRIVSMKTAFRADLALLEAGKLCSETVLDTQRAADLFEKLLVEFPTSPLADEARRRLRQLERENL